VIAGAVRLNFPAEVETMIETESTHMRDKKSLPGNCQAKTFLMIVDVDY
jgi:hypothetical protein